MSKVLIHPATHENNVSPAADRAFELCKGEKSPDKAKRASTAREGIVTNPAVLRAVVEKVEKHVFAAGKCVPRKRLP
jgi:hypothetical protein